MAQNLGSALFSAQGTQGGGAAPNLSLGSGNGTSIAGIKFTVSGLCVKQASRSRSRWGGEMTWVFTGSLS
jgi:hypothetical protein